MIRFLLGSWGIVAGVMLVTWFCFLITQNPSIVDVGWVISITAIGVYALVKCKHPTWAHWSFLGLLLIWTVRLGGFLVYTRIIAGYVDPRYLEIKNSFSSHEVFNFFINYQLQALLASSFAFALYTTFTSEKYSFTVITIAITLIMIGIIGESIADFQLYTFKMSGAKGICEMGLWQYSRHPNYFFELMIWLGFGITGMSTCKTMYSLITPISLWAIMNYVTIPLTEQVALSKKNEYQGYIDRTNKFLPAKTKNILPFSFTHSKSN